MSTAYRRKHPYRYSRSRRHQRSEPDILVKGADYTLSQVVGREIVASYGGNVQLVEVLPGYSTINISKKLLRRAN